MSKMTEMAQELRGLKDRKEVLAEEEKTVNKRIKALTEHELPEYMEENEIDKVTIDGVGTIFIQNQVYANVKSDDRPALYEWLRDTGNEALVVDYVFPATLKAFCKEQLNNGKPVPELVTAHYVPTAMLRRK